MHVIDVGAPRAGSNAGRAGLRLAFRTLLHDALKRAGYAPMIRCVPIKRRYHSAGDLAQAAAALAGGRLDFSAAENCVMA
jgi:hypothetical protein